MAYLEWKPEFSVNIASLDNEHKKLFALVDELRSAMRVGQGASKAPDVLKQLVAYTKTHFANEELQMQRAAYPGFAAHKAEHTRLTQQVTQMVADLEQKKLMISLDLLNFLTDWLTRHILASDKQYSKPLQLAGVR